MNATTMSVRGVEVPLLLYGTAWKEERTAPLVATALAAGFRGIDTANQRKHYHEAGVGEALARGNVPREAVFLQTKFTYAEGQDGRLPYDPRADHPEQVRQSFASSLEHLGTDRIDGLLLHGPRTHRGLSPGDREVWKAMEGIQKDGGARLIGVSNVSAEQLELLCDAAEVLPAFVQNRCFARLGWDRAVRDVCRERGVVYQGFSLLTANRAELALREERAPGRLPLRAAIRDDRPHRDHRPAAHARGPRHLRLRADRGRGERDRPNRGVGR
jgi:diketogulonate reductase-like aldo/keto reductase